MGLLDWLILGFCVSCIIGVALWTKRFNKSVADFLAANRCSGRYIIAAAEGMAMLGAISFIAEFERTYVSGFGAAYWTLIIWPLFTVVALSGWVVYRFRQTKALTLAQFFEMRYSHKFRIFAGLLCFLSGIINFGIFPGIGSKFLVHFCGFPESLSLLGLQIPTYIILMTILLTISVAVIFWGGQIAVMITDFLQGSFTYIILAAITILMMLKFDWGTISETLLSRPDGIGTSYINPFDIDKLPFDYLFVITAIFGAFYSCMGWQNQQGYNSAAKNPHEARMARIVGVYRVSTMLVLVFIPICAYAVMNHPSYSSLASEITAEVSVIDNVKLQGQMVTPVFLSKMLPVGLLGLFATVIIFAFISTHDTFIHSWASILVQDVIAPIRKKPLTSQGHIKLLRVAVIGVAIFAFLWSILLDFREHIIMYWMISSAIFLAGSGAVIIGGLYWKRGTTAGAYSALIVGATLAVGGFVIRHFNPNFPIRIPQISLIASVISISSYVLVSLLTWPKQPFDMDKMLHRGKYEIKSNDAKTAATPIKGLTKLCGITREFTKGDLVIYWGTICLIFGMSITCIGIAMLYVFRDKLGITFGPEQWLLFWKYYIYFVLGLAIFVAIWFTIGGAINTRELFATLSKFKRNTFDDGRVVSGHNLADEMEPVDVDSSDENKQ